MNENTSIGELIVFLRNKHNISQKELANELYVTVSAVCKWEKGAALPNRDYYERLAEVLKISPNDLLRPQETLDRFMEEEKAVPMEESPKGNSQSRKKKVVFFSLLCIVLITLCVVFVQFRKHTFRLVTERCVPYEEDNSKRVLEIAVTCSRFTDFEDRRQYALSVWDEQKERLQPDDIVQLVVRFYYTEADAMAWGETNYRIVFLYRMKLMESGENLP